MKNYSEFSHEELKKLKKTSLIMIISSLQDQLENISNQLNLLTALIALMNQRAFSRKTESASQIPNQQTLFGDLYPYKTAFHNPAKKPDITEIAVSSYTRKEKTKREEKLEGLPARIIEHKLTDEELSEKFPNGYKELPCEIYKRLAFIPQMLMVDEHHFHVYASKNNDGSIVKAKHPQDVFRNSIATPSLISAVASGKYSEHLPLER